jgi:hypothetical protein
MFMPQKLTPAIVFIIAGFVDLALLAIFLSHPGTSVFLLSVFALGFFWLFVMPYQTLLLVRIDPTRRAAMFVPFAQLLGASIGPAVASLVAEDANITKLLFLSAGWVFAWFAGLLWLRVTHSPHKVVGAIKAIT